MQNKSLHFERTLYPLLYHLQIYAIYEACGTLSWGGGGGGGWFFAGWGVDFLPDNLCWGGGGGCDSEGEMENWKLMLVNWCLRQKRGRGWRGYPCLGLVRNLRPWKPSSYYLKASAHYTTRGLHDLTTGIVTHEWHYHVRKVSSCTTDSWIGPHVRIWHGHRPWLHIYYRKASSRGAYGHDPFWRASTWFHNNRYYNGTVYIIDNVIVLSDLVESSGYS